MRFEFLERDPPIDASLGHDDCELLCLLLAEFENLGVLCCRSVGEDRVEDVETDILHPLHPAAGLRAWHRRVLEAKSREAVLERLVDRNAEPPVAASAR